jgi:cysteinyl-tRNA synthetase
MTLRLYNTLTRRKDDFRPLDAGNVRMYVCGPTVYDFAHIGNARPAIVFDVLFRLLRHIYGADHVTYARNITDVDDKINARAGRDFPDLALNDAIGRVTELTERQFHADVAALGCLPPTVEPRATEHIDDMKRMIEALVEKDCAYVAEGHVLFHVAAMPDYGKLSRRSLDEMQAGARVEVAPYKKDPMDFVLWKPSKEGEPGWPSPCGIETPGRPGWHIECSAMAAKYLGSGFDIHGGGTDLIFPHHENEIAQSEGATGETFARYWLHNGMVNLGGEKMAKSTGQMVDLQSVATKVGGRALRMLMVRAHYRSPIEYTEDLVEEAAESLDRLDRFRSRGVPGTPDPDLMERFEAAMDDDFGTPQAISVIFDAVREGNKILDDGGDVSALLGAVEEIVSVLGLDEGSRPEEADIDLEELADRRKTLWRRRTAGSEGAIRSR